MTRTTVAETRSLRPGNPRGARTSPSARSSKLMAGSEFRGGSPTIGSCGLDSRRAEAVRLGQPRCERSGASSLLPPKYSRRIFIREKFFISLAQEQSPEEKQSGAEVHAKESPTEVHR